MSAEPLKEGSGNKRMIAASIIILILIPATIFFGMLCLGDRKYYFVSLAVLCLTMVPFFLSFEQRKPQARELMVVAVLIAIAVAGRAAFFMIPQFKPVTAIVIIAGVCLGGEVGFLVGAMSGFVSNFFFGQGPWTPWQMFSFGIIGFLAGILASRGLLKKKRIPLCIFGGLAAFFIYGGIVDVWTIFMFTPEPSLKTAMVVYGSAVWFNFIHGAATVIFLYLLSSPMMEKLERIKRKYSLME
jgi:energy-coupling factor transport system substrate-specific component